MRKRNETGGHEVEERGVALFCYTLIYSVNLMRGRSNEDDTVEDLSRPHHLGFDTIILHGESALRALRQDLTTLNAGQEDKEPKKRKLRPSRHLETC